MIYVYYFFAAVLIFFSWKSMLGGFAYRRHFFKKLSAPPSTYRPFASIIAPCRGVDTEFAENVARLFRQNYPAYEIVFVVDDERDEAVMHIRSAMEGNPESLAKLVVAAKAKDTAQKSENLREAVRHIDPRAEVLAFVDSDARTGSDWLCSLAAPLADVNVGATTGYRWFVSKRSSVANELLSAWNASIASALGPNRLSNFTWGGSTAIRRETFERLGIREKWSGIVSDDFVLATAVKGAGLEIEFVPHALCASPADVSLCELWEFTTRQMKITRVYRPDLWGMSLFGSALFCGVMIASFVLALLSAETSVRAAASFTLIIVALLSILKSYVRTRAAATALRDHASVLTRHLVTHSLLFALTPPIFLANSLTALFSQTIVWRGTRYRMLSKGETIIDDYKNT